VKLLNRPGELATGAESRLGERRESNINYGYCCTEAVTNSSILIFGVAEAGRQRKFLDLLPRRRGDLIRPICRFRPRRRALLFRSTGRAEFDSWRFSSPRYSATKPVMVLQPASP